MKTCTFIFWISLLVLFSHGELSKSPTNQEQYSMDSENSNEESGVDAGKQDIALQDSFRPRHKYKANGRRTRFYRSNSEASKDQQGRSPHCAVMYKDNEPVGILQPFKESYRFLPVNGDPTLVDLDPVPVKRKTMMDVLLPNKRNEDYNDELAANSQFTDDRYPSIFAKFKIDSRLDKSANPDLSFKRSMYKRDAEKSDISDEQVSSLKSTLSKMNGDNSAVVEEELKNILDDMGLIDDYDEREPIKREVAEDENMEEGTNKINLIKEEHNYTRNKRGDVNNATEEQQGATDTSPEAAEVSTLAQNADAPHEEIHSIDLLQDGCAKLDENSEKQGVDSSTNTDLEESRKKRQFETSAKEDDTKEDKRDTMEALPDINLPSSDLVKEAELNKYEKRVEREIRDKIQKLKDEVKEEIKNLKINPQVKDDESDTRRRKRQVMNTLMEEETQDIDPNFNSEEPQEEHHVRRKRSLLDDSSVLRESDINNNVVHMLDLNDKVLASDKNTKATNNTTTRFENNNPSISGEQELHENKNELRESNPRIKEITKSLVLTHQIPLDIKYERHIETKKDIPRFFKLNTSDDMENDQKTQTQKQIKKLKLKTKRDELHSARDILATNDMTTVMPLNVSFDTKRKKNIINILNVIGKKIYANINSLQVNNHTQTDIQTDVKCDNLEKQINKEDALLTKNNERSTLVKQQPSLIRNARILNHIPSERKENMVVYNNSLKELNSNTTLRSNDNIVDAIHDIRKRFIGINPILENASHPGDHYDDKIYKTETNLENVDSNSDNNVGKTDDIDHYNSRSLKQFDEDTIRADQVGEKRSGDQGDGIKISRKKRQSKEDAEENDYQYDNQFNGDASAAENQVYYDQPYANENNIADSNAVISNSNCNCDKTGSGCKCGAQKSDLSVPSIKRDYSDYMEYPNSVVEKKSVHRCHCDKNGKGCKCLTFGEGSEYGDYAEEQPAGIEKSADLVDSGGLDDLQSGIEERGPRRPRQHQRRAAGDAENVNEAEDYYGNYEMEQGRLMKREVELRNNPAGSEQFQNGEYFVDLHPNIYKLTPVNNVREKRSEFKDLVAIHSGGPARSHLVAIRQRSMLPHPRIRRRAQNDDNKEPRQLIDMSDEDIFGALPQGFAGELARYKRVKRDGSQK